MDTGSKGQPSGTNKSEGTGVPADFSEEKLEKDDLLTERYTENENEVAKNVRQNNPNRNVDKDDATNAGGYKN